MADIQLQKLIFRKTPAAWHPWITLVRLDRPIGTWLLLFPCWWAIVLSHGGVIAMDARGWGHIVLFALGALLMRSAGCIVNDLWDRRMDAQVERTRTRPLASGDITPRQALALLGGLLFLSFLILLSLPPLDIMLGFLSLLLVGVYPLMKRVTWLPQLFLGFTFNWGALMGWAAADNRLAADAFLLYAGGIFWTLAYDTIYAHQDKTDDALVGIKSTALLFGEESKKYVAGFFALAVFFFIAARYAALHPSPSPLTVFVIGHVLWQLYRWQPDNPQSCLMIFKSNAVFGWLVLLMLAF
jgi:4-hydroxybenzoate polyprenyltransferase